MHQRLLAFDHHPERHTGANMAQHVFNALIEFDLMQKLHCITTDNAGNNKTMAHELSSKLRQIDIEWDPVKRHIPCFAHIINLVVTAFVETLTGDQSEVSSFKTVIEKVRALAKSIRSSDQRQALFFDICDRVELRPMLVVLDVVVRWNSTYEMIHTAVYLDKGS
jgi:hypothetical protein